MRPVSVIGVGSTTFGKHPNEGIADLAVLAALAALDDAAMDAQAVQTLYLGNFVSGMLTGQEVLAGLVGDVLGLPNVPCTKVEGACASGGSRFVMPAWRWRRVSATSPSRWARRK